MEKVFAQITLPCGCQVSGSLPELSRFQLLPKDLRGKEFCLLKKQRERQLWSIVFLAFLSLKKSLARFLDCVFLLDCCFVVSSQNGVLFFSLPVVFPFLTPLLNKLNFTLSSTAFIDFFIDAVKKIKKDRQTNQHPVSMAPSWTSHVKGQVCD